MAEIGFGEGSIGVLIQQTGSRSITLRHTVAVDVVRALVGNIVLAHCSSVSKDIVACTCRVYSRLTPVLVTGGVRRARVIEARISTHGTLTSDKSTDSKPRIFCFQTVLDSTCTVLVTLRTKLVNASTILSHGSIGTATSGLIISEVNTKALNARLGANVTTRSRAGASIIVNTVHASVGSCVALFTIGTGRAIYALHTFVGRSLALL